MSRWKERRQDRISRGLCVICGSRPPQAGRTACEPCATTHAQSAAKSRRVKRDGGECVCCPAPALPGLTRCQRCLDANNNRKVRAPNRGAFEAPERPRRRYTGPSCPCCGASVVGGWCELCQSGMAGAEAEIW